VVEYLHADLTGLIIHEAIQVHRALGPGLLESVYETCLVHLLTKRGVAVERQAPIPVQFDGMALEAGFRADLIVDGKVLVELKATKDFEPIFEAQVLTYLKLSGLKVGLLINFHSLRLRDGVKRYVI
jgi:GxxExxY protein